ncbi:MAG: AgmX/PglI C-terminal domain-containing protein [Myxococcota bacterium]|nr:AgmX/PglI C-terminal domain-containing protein [Myxococcota bacterium]
MQRRRAGSSRRPPAEKILRIGVIHNGRIIEERLIPAGSSVTVGESHKNTLVIPPGAVPGKRFELFSNQGRKGYALRFTNQMHGKVAIGGNVETLAALGKAGSAKNRGTHYALKLASDTRGKVYVGDYTFLFPFVTPPPQPVRPRTQDFRAFRWEEVDWIFLAVLLLSALLHTAGVVWIESHPPASRHSLEDFPDRYVKLLLGQEPEEPEEQEVTDPDKKSDEETPAPEPEPEPEPEPAPKKAKVEDNKPKESAEDRQKRLEEEASTKGLLAVIGTTGSSSTSEKVKDLVNDAGSLSKDVGKALAESSGVAVARKDADAAGLRGGGGGDAAGSTGKLGTAGGGPGGDVAKKKTEIKGKVKASGTIDAAPGDAKSIRSKIRRYNGRIRACYEQYLKGDPDLAGTVNVAWDIDTSGKVSGVDIVSNSTGSSALAQCIEREVRKFRFGAQEDELEVPGYKFVLSPG